MSQIPDQETKINGHNKLTFDRKYLSNEYSKRNDDVFAVYIHTKPGDA